jgi:hypothetical protein
VVATGLLALVASSGEAVSGPFDLMRNWSGGPWDYRYPWTGQGYPRFGSGALYTWDQPFGTGQAGPYIWGAPFGSPSLFLPEGPGESSMALDRAPPPRLDACPQDPQEPAGPTVVPP